MYSIGYIEKVDSYSETSVSFSGYIKYQNTDSWNSFKYSFVVKINSEIKKKLSFSNYRRTDLEFEQNKDENYNFIGFQDISIRYKDLLHNQGKFSFGILVEKNEKSKFIPLIIKLSVEKNKLVNRYIKIDRSLIRVSWKCDIDKSIYMLAENITRFRLLQDYFTKIRVLLRRLKWLFKNSEFKTINTLLLWAVLNKFLSKRDIWLIGERVDTAQDNSFHLFKYIIANQVKVNAFYVIDKHSKDYEKLRGYHNVIQWGSIKHSLYLLCSAYSINSYLEKPNMYTKEYIQILRWYPNIVKRKKVFLQHGVIGTSRVNNSLFKNKAGFDLFVVCSEFEKNHIIDEYGYNEEEVAVTGLCRWDGLNEANEIKEILIMPTWRKWIDDVNQLIETDYYKKYYSLLRNKDFINILYKNNYTVKFYLHYKMQKCSNLFKRELDNRINIINQGEEEVQSLLKESRVLITDYSSVSYDFAYMNKPVIFYQFDHEAFYSKHYNKGPVDFGLDMFGKVVYTEDHLVKYIGEIIENNELVCAKKNQINKYIKYFDDKNCYRNFEAIRKIK